MHSKRRIILSPPWVCCTVQRKGQGKFMHTKRDSARRLQLPPRSPPRACSVVQRVVESKKMHMKMEIT